MNNKIGLIILLTVAFLGLAGLDSLQGQQDAELILDAQEKTWGNDGLFILKGSVEVAWKEYRIYADYLECNYKTKELIAEGRVTMCSGETTLSGDKLRFNWKTKTGELYEAYGQSPPTVRYTTDKLEQVDNDTLKFKKMDFTTCSQCTPRWKITCTEGKIKKEKYIEMKNVVFRIKNIPFFYLPYLRYPLDKDGRATGILFPGIGSSSIRGFFIQNSFFWAFSKHADLTLYSDYFAKAGAGFAGELRYLFPHMGGNVKYYYFSYKDGNTLKPGGEPDYYLKMDHRNDIEALNTSITINIDRQSDANFLRMFANDFDTQLFRSSRSSVNIETKLTPNLRLNVNASQNDTFYTFKGTTNSLRYKPEITLNLFQQKLWIFPAYFSLNSVFASAQRVGEFLDPENNTYSSDISSTRFSINPGVYIPMVSLSWFSAGLTASTKHTFYRKSQDPKTRKVLNEPLHLGYQSVTLDAKGPVFGRIFEFRNFKLKHLIEPKISLRYVTEVKDEDRARLITLDNFDFPSHSMVQFSLNMLLLYKENKLEASAREIFSYTVSQDYYFDPKLASRNRVITIPDPKRAIFPSFSNLTNTLRLRPVKDFSLDVSLLYNHYLQRFINKRINLSYNNPSSVIRGGFYFSSSFYEYNSDPKYIFNRDNIGGNLLVSAPEFPLSIDARVNYDITDKLFRQASFLLRYSFQCITLRSELKLFKISDRVETQFVMGVSFGNLGQVKDFLGVEK